MSTPNMPAATLSDRITQLTLQFSRHESAIGRSANITTAVGVIALIALSIYFYFGYTMIADLLEPKNLVPLGAKMLDDRLPEAREALVKQISQSAPGWAKEVSVQARKEIPGLRDKLEDYVLSNTYDLLVKVTNLTEDQFRKTIRENRELLDGGFKELANSEKLSEEAMNALVNALEQELKSDMKSQAEIVLETLRYLSERIQRLASGKNLDEQECYMRQSLMIARRMRDTTADETPIQLSELKSSATTAAVTTDIAKLTSENAEKSSKADKPDAKRGD